MIVMPAIDLREGACVQLVGGDYAAERVRLPDPRAVAAGWAAAGFREIHVVDLDAATGRGSNRHAITSLCAMPGLRAQVGGGLRDEADIASLIDGGAARVVVGTRAIADPAWLARVAERFPRRVVVAADVRGREIVVRGWEQRTALDVTSLLHDLAALPLAGVLVTAVHREGRLEGPDLDLMETLAATTSLPLHASGGITTPADLRALASLGIARAILGMALYTGTLDPRAVAEEFAA